MRHLISLVLVLLVSITCKGLERKEIAVSNLSMVVKTSTEQIHWLYGAADFVTKNEDKMDCDANTLWNDNTITVLSGTLFVNKGSEDEQKFKIVSCTYTKDNVFADAGVSETHRLMVNPISEDGVSKLLTFITIEKVTNAGKARTIVTIPAIDVDGRLQSVNVYTTKSK